MKKSLTAMLACSALVLSFGLASAQAQESVSVSAAENGNLWFVELSGNPTADGNSLKNVRAEKAAFKKNAAAVGVNYKERRSFDVLFNGYSVEVAPGQLSKLRSIPGVKAVWPVAVIERPPVEVGGTPDLFTAIQMTGADIAHGQGVTGLGVKVAIMDTGIDYDHADLGGDGVTRSNSTVFPTARVVTGWDFVGDAFDGGNMPIPDAYPDDCNGHGSHVAGIVGANGTVTGVAPDVTFGAYRVFGCEGSTTADIMIAAMERALADGMQVLNMSIGSSFQWPQYPTAVASDRAVARGMIVVASIGNSGVNGTYAAGAPGVGRDVIGVASFENSHARLPYFTVNDNKVGYQTMTFSAAPPTSGSAEITYIGRACNVDTLDADPTGKAALAIRGTCSFAEKAINAINAGATAVVIYNNVAGVVNGTLGGSIGSDVPVVGISQADGVLIRAQAAPITMTWTDQQDSFPSPTGGLISSFSSYGLAPDLSLKPDIGAPGGNIYSTYPLELGGHAVLGGTSMASPHVAGAAALLRQARPSMPAKAARDYLQNSADPKLWSANTSYGLLDYVHRQGAGMVDIDDSINATTMVTPAKIAVGEGAAGPRAFNLTVRNTSGSPVTYDLSSINALSSNRRLSTISGGVVVAAVVGAFVGNAIVALDPTVVTVPPNGSMVVSATITPATSPSQGTYGGYIVLTPQGGGQVYRVPFAGFVGDYQGIVHMPPVYANPWGFPWLAKLLPDDYFYVVPLEVDGTFTMVGDDIPWFVVHFDHHPRRVEFQVLDAKNGKPVHPVFSNFDEFDYVGRNSSNISFYAFPWDGTRMHDNGKGTPDHRKVVPNGKYKVVLKVLKALGNPANLADWETWTSPEITLARP